MESWKEKPKDQNLCIKSSGVFSNTTTMNNMLCSKCHKDETILKEQQAKLAVASIDIIVSGSSCSNSNKEALLNQNQDVLDVKNAKPEEEKKGVGDKKVAMARGNRCSTCRKRVGLFGFNCKCGHLFCSVHRYSDKHDCPYDYRTEAQESIAKANPVVKKQKLHDRI